MSRSDGASGQPQEGAAVPSSAPVDWAKLPDALRSRLADIAATAVGAMPAVDVPVPLRRLAGFTPAKRAKLGGTALTGELAASAAFRTAVVAWWEEHRPGELTPAADEPLIAAAAAVLNDDPDAGEAVAAAARRGEAGELRAERDAALSRVDKLTTELERLRGELTEARAQARMAGQQRDHEYQQLRRRVSEQGAKLRAARDAQAAAGQAAREARKADEVRLSLLIDTLGGALTGLRRELALGGGGPRPGDLVAGARAARGGSAVGTVAELDALLTVPSLHL